MDRKIFTYSGNAYTDEVYAVADTFAVSMDRSGERTTALQFVLARDNGDGMGWAGELLLTVNVNIETVPADHIAIKTWDNRGNMIRTLMDQQLIEGECCEQRKVGLYGMVVHIYKKGPALLDLEAQRDKEK